MEKFFTNKSIWKKIVVAVLIVMAFQFVCTIPVVRADGPEEGYGDSAGDPLGWAGPLMKPVLSLIVTLADGMMNILHSAIMGQDVSLITVEEGNWLEKIGAVLIGLLVAVAIAAAVIWIGFAAVIPAIAAFGSASGIAVGGAIAGVGYTTIKMAFEGALIVGTIVGADKMPGTFKLPVYSYSAEEIFKGNILLFDVNFFDPDAKQLMVNYSIGTPGTMDITNTATGTGETTEQETAEIEWTEAEPVTSEEYDNISSNSDNVTKVNYYYYMKDGVEVRTSAHNAAKELHSIIARWYVTIRNICIVMMLSVLVYIGIRMMLTTVSNEKAKYKDMLKDWVVGLCLLFIMHYIMSFSVTIVEKITSIVDTSIDQKAMVVKIPAEKYEDSSGENSLIKVVRELGIPEECINETNKEITYPTNLLGKSRILMQLNDEAELGTYIGYVICFLILVIFTVLFTFTYVKRLLYMAFLTLISPMVAMTYCIDKVNDGQAQGFNMWLKEYIFNLLIQPLHLLLYYILISSAFELSSTNIIYSLVALGFMIPAEKLLRSMFGFEKAKTPPLLGGPVGTSLMMQGISGLSRLARGGKSKEEEERKRKADSNENEGKQRLSGAEMFSILAGDEDKEEQGENPILNSLNEQEDEGISDFDYARFGQAGESKEDTQRRLEDENARKIALEQQARQAYAEFGEDDESYEDFLLNKGAAYGLLDEPIRQKDISEEDIDKGANENISSVSNRRRAMPHSNSLPTRFSAFDNFKRTGGRYFKAAKAGAKIELKTRAKRLPKTAFKVAKGVAGGVIAGGAVATLGAAAAIASGDEKNVVTAAGAAIGTGYAVGRRTSRSNASSHLTKETREAFDQTFHGPEYEKDDINQASSELRSNDNYKLKVEQGIQDEETKKEIQKEEAKGFEANQQRIQELQKQKANNEKQYRQDSLKDDGYIDQLYQRGITKEKDLIVLSNGIVNGVFDDVDDAAANYEFNEIFGHRSPDRMGKKDRDNFNHTLQNGIKNATGGRLSDAQTTKQMDVIISKQNYLGDELNR